MKRKSFFLTVVAFATMLSFASCDKENKQGDNSDPYAIETLQVSKDAANRNVVLEEFTGVNCGYCPDGHRIANEMMAANPGRVFAINIHVGPYASKYKTQWGSAIANQTGLTGYPAGTINRIEYNGTMALNRSEWKSKGAAVMAQASCVNLASRAIIDTAARTMTVQVKGYYTDNSATATNMLNVAVLQNDVVGPQSGGSNFNSAQVDANGQYHHMHMLRHLITDQWGDEITSTTQGSEFAKSYTWEIPASISGENVVMTNLDVVVFMAEGHTNIITGTEAEVVIK